MTPNSQKKLLHLTLIVVSLPVIFIISGLSRRVLHFPVHSVLLIAWFCWAVWFSVAYKPFSRKWSD